MQYREKQASASDALLVIEVSDTTLRKDLRVKIPLYERYGVYEVWIVDLEKSCLRFYRSLIDAQYQQVSVISDPRTAPVPGLVNTAIDLTGLLAP